MFNIFKKQDKPEVTDMVFMSKLGKYKGLHAKFLEQDTIVIIYYFKDTWAICKSVFDGMNIAYKELPQNVFETGKVNCLSADHLMNFAGDLSTACILFIEHFPSYAKESELLQYLYSKQVRKADFFTSLDEPLFGVFGGEKISDLMKKMGMTEDEAISHSMVTQSITNAQKKIDDNLRVEMQADSMEEWLRLNTIN